MNISEIESYETFIKENNMTFTFGIITDGNYDHYINEIIRSIEDNNIPIYEIIIVGNTKINETDKIKIIYFDDSIKEKWISRKKNIIIENSRYEILVLMHDYIILDKDWYKGFLQYGKNFDWCITPITNTDGKRFRDYTLAPFGSVNIRTDSFYEIDYLKLNYNASNFDNYFGEYCLLPYDYENNEYINKYMYISGCYFIIKRNIALTHKIDETLLHGEGEDVEYSRRLHANNIIIKCNKYSKVYLLKYKNSIHWEREISHEKMDELYNKILL